MPAVNLQKVTSPSDFKKKEPQIILEPTVDIDELVAINVSKCKENFAACRLLEISPFANFVTNCTQKYNSRKLDYGREDELDLTEERNDDVYAIRQEERKKLKIYKKRQDICDLVACKQVVLIEGRAGCGKSTQVPQFILEDYITKGNAGSFRIVCIQPQPVAAIALANRIAYERAEEVGCSVGYEVDSESKLSREHTLIAFYSAGAFLQELRSRRPIEKENIWIIDELHQRTIECDLLLALIKLMLPLMPHLRVVLMCASDSRDHIQAYFDNCPMLSLHRKLTKVEQFYLEDILQETSYEKLAQPNDNGYAGERKAGEYIELVEPYLTSVRHKYDNKVFTALRNKESEGCQNLDFLCYLIYYISENQPAEGAILVLVPEIVCMGNLIRKLKRSPSALNVQKKLIIYALKQPMKLSNDADMFDRRVLDEYRKVIIATSLDASLAFDDVAYIVNSGRIEMRVYDNHGDLMGTEETWISKSQLKERTQRLGHVPSGALYNLFSRARKESFEDHPEPEILRSKLEHFMFDLKAFHVDNFDQFIASMISPPPQKLLKNALVILKSIDVLDEEENLTPLGDFLSKLPVNLHPQLGKMVFIAAIFRCLDPITTVAALLSYKNPFRLLANREKYATNKYAEMSKELNSDHLIVHDTLLKYRQKTGAAAEHFAKKNFLDFIILAKLESIKSSFVKALYLSNLLDRSECTYEAFNVNSECSTIVRAVIASGLYPNVAYMQKPPHSNKHAFIIENKRPVNFHPFTANSTRCEFDSKFFVYFEKLMSTQLYLREATIIEPEALLLFGDKVERLTYADKGRIGHALSVDGKYNFKIAEKDADTIFELRELLQAMVYRIAAQPGRHNVAQPPEYLMRALESLLCGNKSLE